MTLREAAAMQQTASMGVSYAPPKEQLPFIEIVPGEPEAFIEIVPEPPTSEPDSNVKQGLRLFKFQQEAVEWLRDKPGAILADEMGVGKTAAGIAWGTQHRPVLVICPASLVLNWAQKELGELWRRNDSVVVLDGQVDFPKPLPDWTVCSFGQVARYLGDIERAGYQAVIVDEAHGIRNLNTAQSQNVLDIVAPEKSAPDQRIPPYRLAITGTPIKNTPMEAFPLMLFVGLRTWDDLPGFRFMLRQRQDQAAQEVYQILKPVMLRRKKADVYPALPPKVHETLVVPITTADEYELAEGAFLKWLQEQEGTLHTRAQIEAQALVRLQALRGIAAMGKVAPVADWLTQCGSEGVGETKALIFSTRIEPLEMLQKRHPSSILYTGTLSKEDRQAFVDRFQREPGLCYFMGTYGAAGVGITLTAADRVVLFDLPWTPADKQQAEDRAHRFGQKRTVEVYNVLAKNTVDERVLELLDEKEQVISEAVEGTSAGAAAKGSVAGELLRRLRREASEPGRSHQGPYRYVSDDEAEAAWAEQSQVQLSVGDRVMYQGEEWEVGFVNNTLTGFAGTLRLQKSGDAGARRVNHVEPKDVTLVVPATPNETTFEDVEKEVVRWMYDRSPAGVQWGGRSQVWATIQDLLGGYSDAQEALADAAMLEETGNVRYTLGGLPYGPEVIRKALVLWKGHYLERNPFNVARPDWLRALDFVPREVEAKPLPPVRFEPLQPRLFQGRQPSSLYMALREAVMGKRVTYQRGSLESTIDAAHRLGSDKPLFVFPTAGGYRIDHIAPPFKAAHYRIEPSGEVFLVEYTWADLGVSSKEVRTLVPRLSRTRLLMSQIPDDWGSRCRDPLGRWTISDLCPPVPRGERASSAMTFALSADGTRRYDFEHKVVEATDLITSHDPFTFELNSRFTQKLQPRKRERAATQVQVQKIAKDLEPLSLLTDFRTFDRGAPIVGPDFLVESGNGRVMGYIRASREYPERVAAYREAMLAHIGEFGLTAADVEDKALPLLIRMRITPLTDAERQKFVEEANLPSGITRSAVEIARTDAERITLDLLLTLDVGEEDTLYDALKASRNRVFVQRFLGTLPENERGQLLDSQGVVNLDGIRRIGQAVFVYVFRGETGLKLAELAFETLDNDIRNAFGGIARALGPMAQAEALTTTGARAPDLAIGEDLATTLRVYVRLRGAGTSVADYLAQGQLESRELTPFQEDVLKTVASRARSAKRVGEVLRRYSESVIAQPPPSQGSMFGDVRITKEELWQAARAGEQMDYESETAERARRREEKAEPSLVAAQDPGVYVSFALSPESDRWLRGFIVSELGLPEPTWPLHVTTVYSRTPFDYVARTSWRWEELKLEVVGYEILTGQSGKPSLVLRVEAEALWDSHMRAKAVGASWDFPEYKPHITIAYDADGVRPPLLPKPRYILSLDPGEIVEPLQEDWQSAATQSTLAAQLRQAIGRDALTKTEAEFLLSWHLRHEFPKLPNRARFVDSLLRKGYLEEDGPNLNVSAKGKTYLEAHHAEITLRQAIGLAARDPKASVDWCNLDPERVDSAWAWRPFRDAIAFAKGLRAKVQVCGSELSPDSYILAADFTPVPHDSEARLRYRQRAKAMLRDNAREVLEFGTNRVIFEVVLPGAEPQDLKFRPQLLPTHIPRREEGTMQPALFQAAQSKASVHSHSSPAQMLAWQYKVLIGELQQLQTHALDPTCPCGLAEISEWCHAKHLLSICALAWETSTMTGDPAHHDLLVKLGDEANDLHMDMRVFVQSPKDAKSDVNLVEWSRTWRKQLEGIYYSKAMRKAEVKELATMGNFPIGLEQVVGSTISGLGWALGAALAGFVIAMLTKKRETGEEERRREEARAGAMLSNDELLPMLDGLIKRLGV